MRIAHVCLSQFFVDGRAYQENELVRQHVRDGHEVLVLASTETHSSTGHLTYCEPGEYVGVEGAPVRRLAYWPALPHFLAKKLRINVGVQDALLHFRPDVILFHGTCGWELRSVAHYVSRHPGVALYVDSHEDWNNSARTLVSRELLHRRYYGPILRSVLPHIRKILCVSTETIDFVANLYDVPYSRLEFFPLGGHPFDDAEYAGRRLATRRLHGIGRGEILLVQSGRQTTRKKLLETLRALASCEDHQLRLFVIGVLCDDIRDEAEQLIASDNRVAFLGWKSPDQLSDLLCAADVYVQPGTQSATMQHALCCRCAVVLDDVPAHRAYFKKNGWLIGQKQSLPEIFQQVGLADLTAMQASSYEVACELLNYKALSKRILQ